MTKKLSIDEIKNKFKEKNWNLISNEYLGSQRPLKVICSNGHETSITWNNFQRGQGCKFCAGNIKYSLENIKKIFQDNGCTALLSHYENNGQKIDYICKCGNKSQIIIRDFIRGHRCAKCKKEKLSQKNKTSEIVIKQFCEQNQCEFIESYIKNKRTKIKFKCKCGQIHEAMWCNFRKFPNCWNCGLKKKSGINCYKWNPNREQIQRNKLFQKRCYNLLRRTLNKTQQFKVNKKINILGYSTKELEDRIINHPKFDLSWTEWHIDHIFPVKAFLDYGIDDIKIINCLENLQPMSGFENLSKGSSYNKDDFICWLNKMNFKPNNINNIKEEVDAFSKNFTKIKVDLINPKNFIKRKSIKDKKQIDSKHKEFVINLLPHEWINRKEQCKQRLLALENSFSEKIYARNCIVSEVSTKVHSEFCNKYHLQGSNKLSFIAWGIFFQGNLQGTISLGRHPRNNNIILDRLCFGPKHQIIGGASKLFKNCIKWLRENNIKNIISFSDNRWSNGDVYVKLGFKLDIDLLPDYYYVKQQDPTIYVSKQSQKKSLTGCPKDKTESEWAYNMGLIQSWDFGKKRWIYNI